MNLEIILIFSALGILIIGYAFKRIIKEEYQLLRQAKDAVYTDRASKPIFFPLLASKKAQLLVHDIEELNKIQIQLKKTFLAKYFINDQHINASRGFLERQKQLEERAENGEDQIFFLTQNMNSVVATLDFSKEELQEIGHLIDQAFPYTIDNWTADWTGLFALKYENGQASISLLLQDDNTEIKKSYDLQAFVNCLAQTVFHGKHVILRVELPSPSDAETYISELGNV